MKANWFNNAKALFIAAMPVLILSSATLGQGPAAGQAPAGQGPGGQRGAGRGAQAAPLPDKPTAVSLPTVSAEVTGPGKPFDSTPSLPTGRGLDRYKYEVREYFISGTANGKPYKTRIMVRRPASGGKFSGLAIVEAMHPSGAAHMFEFTSDYTMTTGHMAVEVVTNLTELLADNKERYKDLSISGDQVSEVLAQAGALIKQKQAGTPFAGLAVKKMVLLGTSATAATLIGYLPAHMVYRTPDMQRIYDGFLPMSTGATIRQIDVPLIEVPTMTEVFAGNVSTRPDGDAPGDQFRIYEFAGMAHVDSRDSVRFKPDPCGKPISQFPEQVYMSVALRHLLDWVDKGKVPPRAERIVVDKDTANDGSPMALDENGNAKGGIRNPYVDVPIAKFAVRNEAHNPPIPNPSAWVAGHGQGAPAQMCGLAGYQEALSKDQLQKLYSTKKNYQDRVRKRLDELEKAGWSLPVYRDLILEDAARVSF
jgi:Alpha/beta hydrolase domain